MPTTYKDLKASMQPSSSLNVKLALRVFLSIIQIFFGIYSQGFILLIAAVFDLPKTLELIWEKFSSTQNLKITRRVKVLLEVVVVSLLVSLWFFSIFRFFNPVATDGDNQNQEMIIGVSVISLLFNIFYELKLQNQKPGRHLFQANFWWLLAIIIGLVGYYVWPLAEISAAIFIATVSVILNYRQINEHLVAMEQKTAQKANFSTKQTSSQENFDEAEDIKEFENLEVQNEEIDESVEMPSNRQSTVISSSSDNFVTKNSSWEPENTAKVEQENKALKYEIDDEIKEQILTIPKVVNVYNLFFTEFSDDEGTEEVVAFANLVVSNNASQEDIFEARDKVKKILTNNQMPTSIIEVEYKAEFDGLVE